VDGPSEPNPVNPAPALYFDETPMKTTLIYVFALAAVSLASCSRRQPPAAQSPVTWTIAPIRTPLKSGESISVRIDATLQDGWHIYSITQPAGGPIPTRISLPPGQPFVLAGNPVPSVPPHVAFDDAFHMSVQLHEKAVGFTVPIRLIGVAPAAADSVHVNVRYQVCNASLCYPPQTARLATPFPVAGT
jgi:DsbC/DsbD-like thiol-disulfide interchange protein